MKKFIYIILGLIGTVIALLLLAPLFISVDKFRPQIVEMAESKLRAKVELGTLKLRLFPTFKISSDSILVTPLPQSGFVESVVQSQGVAVEASLLSMLSSPALAVHVDNPTVTIVSKNQKTNIEAILPEVTPEQAAAQAKVDAAVDTPVSATSALGDLPPMVRTRVEAASFSLFIQQAHLIYRDLDSKAKIDLSKVDFSLKNIGLNQNMQARLDALIDFKGDGITAVGPMKAEVDVVSKMTDNQDLSLEISGTKDLSGLDLRMTDLFVKKSGIPFGAAFAGTVRVGKNINMNLTTLSLEFGTLAVKGSMNIVDLTGQAAARVALNLKSNSLNLADLKSYVPMIASYKVLGKADFSASIDGPLANPTLDILLGASGVQGSSPALATPIKNLSADVRITGTLAEPLVDVKKVQMAIGKNSDLSMRGTVRGMQAPVVDFYVDSKHLDLDEIMGTPSDGKAAVSATSAKADAAVSKLPLDESLSQMAPTLDDSLKNPMLDKLRAKLQTKLLKVKFMGAEYLDAALLMNLVDRELTISKTSLRAYKGVIALSGSLKLVPKNTDFKFSTNLSNINMGDVVKAHAPDWVGALSGSALGFFEISGQGLTKEQLQKNLRGTIKGDIKNGKTNLAVVKVVNQVLAAIPKNLSSALSSKAQASTKNQFIEGTFEIMKLDANIVGRKVNLKTFDTIFTSSQEKLGKFRFTADGFVTFDQDVDMVGTAFLSPELIRVPQLKGKSGQIEIPLKFGGKTYEPVVDYQYSIKRLTETAGKQILQTEGKKAIEKLLPQLEKIAPKALQKNLKDLKKLFR